jgi:putative spermidine/putrescine transport system ATP-binding protein
MSDRIAVFNDGVVQQLSSPTDLYEHPQNSFVARFIGENNAFAGTLLERNADDNVCRLELPTGEIVHGVAGGDIGPGDAATVFIRPERMRPGAAEGSENLVAATVIDRIYHGDHTRCVLAAGGASDVILKIDGLDGPRSAQAGDRLSLTWNSLDARIFRA